MIPPSNPIRVEFARRLKALRIQHGFKTARSLARELSIDENRYTRYERAEVEPDLELIHRICKALEVTPNHLLWEAAPGTSSKVPPGLVEALPLPPLSGTTMEARDDQLALATAPANTSSVPTGAPIHHHAAFEKVKCSALAWQLAHELVIAEMPAEESKVGDDENALRERAFEAFLLTSQKYKEIKVNPITYVARLSGSLAKMEDKQRRTRLASMAKKLIDSVQAAVLP